MTYDRVDTYLLTAIATAALLAVAPVAVAIANGPNYMVIVAGIVSVIVLAAIAAWYLLVYQHPGREEERL